MELTYVATCLFGLERLVGEEIDALGYTRRDTIDGRVYFKRKNTPFQILSIKLNGVNYIKDGNPNDTRVHLSHSYGGGIYPLAAAL